MTVVEWDGIPERYWPDTEKPWRVTWGFGVFEDFRTKREAQAFHRRLLESERGRGGGWDGLVNEPFNAIDREVS